MTDATSQAVVSQSRPLAGAHWFSGNRAPQDTLRRHLPGCNAARFQALGVLPAGCDLPAIVARAQLP